MPIPCTLLATIQLPTHTCTAAVTCANYDLNSMLHAIEDHVAANFPDVGANFEILSVTRQ